MGASQVRQPRAEATRLLPPGYVARVLEPSPPAHTDPEWWADDPTHPGDADGSVVTPIPGEGVTWSELAAARPHLRQFVAENWLDGSRRLGPLSTDHDLTRRSLHQLAFFVLAPARYAATGRLGLRYTRYGFGTPFFGDDEQVRVESGRLVRQRGEEVMSMLPDNLEDACDFVGIAYREEWFEGFRDPLSPVGPQTPIVTERGSAASIGDWFGFATLVLERTRRLAGTGEMSRVQLWPEHFDAAIETGSDGRGTKVSYGASPGDDLHPEPYLYVAPAQEVDTDEPFWNDPTFGGASLPYREILSSENQLETALDFFRRGHERLARTAV